MTKIDLRRKVIACFYLGVLCNIIEAGDVHAELSSLGELAKANTERDELVTTNARCLSHHGFTIGSTQGGLLALGVHKSVL